MEPSSPHPTTEIDSASTMLAHFKTTALSCQLQLEHALSKLRYRTGDISPPEDNSMNFELENSIYIETLKKRRHNPELFRYYKLANNIVNNNQRYHRTRDTHRAGMFLLDYFQDEFQAIKYLEDISLKTLDRLSNSAKQEIIRARPLRANQLPQLVQGLNDNGADDLWRPGQNSLESWLLYNRPVPSPPAPISPLTKKRRRNADDSEEERVTSLIDFRRGTTPTTRNLLGISSTLILDDFPLFNLRRVEENPVTGQLIITNRV